jgi:hypothetical protein
MMDFSKIDDGFRTEIVKGGETYLEGLLKLATSADSRASGLAGMFTAAATALTAGVVIALGNAPGADGGVAAALFFLIGAIVCIRSIQPIGFWLPGCEPDNWEDDVSQGKQLKDCMAERAMHIQDHINKNVVVIEKNANLFKWGTRFGIGAPFVGFAIWTISNSWHGLLLFLSHFSSCLLG